MDVVKPGTTSDVYSVNAAVTQAVAGRRRRRKSEQRVFRDRDDTRRVRSAQPARMGPSRLHSRRQLRPDRLRVRRRSSQPFVRQLSGRNGRHARPARAAALRRRRNGRPKRERPRRIHQPSDQDRHVSRLRQRQRAASARRALPQCCNSKSAARRPTGSSPITSGSAATIKISAILISSTVRISATFGVIRSSHTTRRTFFRRRVSGVRLHPAGRLRILRRARTRRRSTIP